MTCVTCKYHWCWVCLGEFKNHDSYFNCNKFDPKKAEADAKNAESAKTEIERYNFYFERWLNHKNSIKNVKNKMENQGEKIKILHELRGFPSSELEFLYEGVREFSKVSATLMWSYCFGYYCINSKDEKA